MARSVPSNRHLLACGALLLLAAGVVFLIARNHPVEKRPLPLRSPLSQLNKERLRRYRVVTSKQIEPAVLDVLGTSEYVQWVVEELDPKDGQGRRLSLLVTYYTGSFDRALNAPIDDLTAPYVVLARADETVTISARGHDVGVPFTLREFRRVADNKRSINVEFLYADGRFCGDWAEARRIVRQSTSRFAYLSKVTVHIDLDPRTTKKQAVVSAKRFLQALIPTLLEDHWPNDNEHRD